jgi:DNA-binding SARP family transcriptional activator/tetratricopeptide (TPR) repeat protein
MIVTTRLWPSALVTHIVRYRLGGPHHREASTMRGLRLRLLGPPSVEIDGAAMHVDTRKAIAVLAYLALEGPQSRESLAGLLWPDSTDTRARAALRRTLSVLNRALGGRWLDSARDRVALHGDDCWCDVTAFRAGAAPAAHAHTGQVCEQCLDRLSEAAALHRGDFLAGFTLRDSAAFDEWMIVETEALRRECSGVLERLVDGLTSAGRLDDAITHAHRLVALDALHEPAHRRLMQLYAWHGRRGDAIHQYRACVATLDRELGVRPLDETVALYQAILEDRVPPPPRAGQAAAPAGAHTAQTEAAPSRRVATPLVGRDAAVSELMETYAQVGAGGRLLAVTGEAGIGKTRLAEEVAARVAEVGATVLAVRCQPGDQSLAYAPVAEALRDAAARPDAQARLESVAAHWRAEAGRLVPAIGPADGVTPAEPLTSPGAQARFVEGVWQVLGAALAGDVPGLLIVDDLQWADDATLQLLTYVITRLRGRHLALLCCWRDDELAEDRRWTDTVRAAQDDGSATVLTLGRLDIDHIEVLLASTTDPDDRTDPRLATRLHTEAEGLPLAVVAYLEELEGPTSDGDWPMPHSLEQLFRTRVASLDQTARQVLTAAATIGRSFDFDTAMAASGRTDGETVAALETLTARGMVRELEGPAGPPLFDFTHDKLRSVVYDAASLARRRLLHGRVADALRGRPRTGDQPLAPAGLIARHEQLAGRDASAAEMFALAGEQARALYANTEALDHLRQALALGHPDAAALHEAVGDLETLRGDYGAALVSYDNAAATAVGPTLAGLEHRCAHVHLRMGDIDAARARLDAAVAALGDAAEPGLRARIAADRSLAAARAGAIDEAELEARRALDLAERASDRRALAQARNILGLLARRTGRLGEAERQLEYSADLAGALPEPDAQITALNNLALVLGDAHRYDHALEHARTAVRLCERIGDRHRQAALHNNIADLLHGAGREDEAMAHLTTAVTLFADVGDQASAAPEIWKLVDW